MISNSQPWDNLKFDRDGVDESAPQVLRDALQHLLVLRPLRQRGRLHGQGAGSPRGEATRDRPLDHFAAQYAGQGRNRSLEDYDPTPAARAIQEFVGENLSNWYVRLNRKRFWGGGMNGRQTGGLPDALHLLETVTMLAAPFAPFITDRIFRDLNAVSGRHTDESVHLATFPKADERLIDTRPGRDDVPGTEAYRQWCWPCAAKCRSRCASRSPKILIPVLDPAMAQHISAVKNLIMNEVNVKEVELIERPRASSPNASSPTSRRSGPRYGKWMKQIAAMTAEFSQERIAQIEAAAQTVLDLGLKNHRNPADFEITSEDMPGWLVHRKANLP